MHNNQESWVDEMIDVLNTKPRSKNTESCHAKIIRSNHDPDIGTVVVNNAIVFSVNGIGNLSDQELESVQIDITGTGKSLQARVRYFRSLNPSFTPVQQSSISSKINLPNQNYLALRKSKY